MPDIAWTLEPEFAFTRRAVRRAVQSPASGGFVQRRRLTERELPVCVLRWEKASSATLYAIEQFWKLTKRGVLPVLYTPPGETGVRYRMLGPFSYRIRSAHGGTIEVELEALR